MEEKIKQIEKRHDELERQLQDSNLIADQNNLKKISREYNDLGEVLDKYKNLQEVNQSLAETKNSLREETDQELLNLASEELQNLEKKKVDLEKEIKEIIEPQNPLDKKDTLIEIRAGTGGDEAALFAADLFRMYHRFAEKKGWQTNLINASHTGIGGLKEAIFEVKGRQVYSQLKFESGVHRVQRVPKTEKSGRIHTSAATVAIMPVAEEVDIELKPEDLKIETSTSRGHGGQSVNTTYSAIRLTHLPTGLIVSCQDERSQQQNRIKALQVLRSRLLAAAEEKRQKEESQKRKSQIGTGDRSEKIRTYNFSQNRVTDHRINKSWHNLTEILDGDLDEIINSLKTADETPRPSPPSR
ncbi:MAG: peptide chain release factor 1 [Patescibacteria group bacterium]